MYEDLADFSIKYAEKLGASYSEARLEQVRGSGFILKNGIPELSSFNDVVGLGVKFLVNKTLGFVSINKFDKKTVKNFIQRGMKLTKNSSKIGEKINFSKVDVANINVNYKVKQKINIEDVNPDEKLKILFDIENQIKGKSVPSRFFILADNVAKKYFINSEGTKITAEIPKVGFTYMLTIKEKANSIQRYWQYGAAKGFECLREWNLPEKLEEEVKALKNNLKFGKRVPAGKIDVIAAPEITGIMVHESVGHPYEADRILGREGAQAGESFVTVDMLNKRIGSDAVTVVDDPTVKNSYGFYLYDDEGVKARRKYLIKNGIITELLQNRETAFKLGLKSNGSARANFYDKEAIVRMSNTFMLPGNYSEEELIEDVKLGVYIKNFMEWNIDDKRFHQKYVGNEAYLIKNGEIKEPVKRPAIEITTPALYSSIDAVSKKIEYHAANCGKGEPMQDIPVYLGGPSIRIRNIKLK